LDAGHERFSLSFSHPDVCPVQDDQVEAHCQEGETEEQVQGADGDKESVTGGAVSDAAEPACVGCRLKQADGGEGGEAEEETVEKAPPFFGNRYQSSRERNALIMTLIHLSDVMLFVCNPWKSTAVNL
jgi:hypothetical protein